MSTFDDTMLAMDNANTKDWLPTAIANLDWINGGEPYWEQDYAAFKVDRQASFNTNFLMFSAHVGGYAVYPSDIAAMAPRLESDLLGRIIDLAHERKMKVGIYWLATTPSSALQAREHPDWQQRQRDQTTTGCMCYTSPFGRHTLGQVSEVLERYEVDAIYFDQMPVACYCAYCRDKFRKRFGIDMTALEKEISAKPFREVSSFAVEAERGGHSLAYETEQLQQFTQENTDWWVQNVRALVDQHRPVCAYGQGKIWGAQLRHHRKQFDYVMPEVMWWTVGWNLDYLALHRQICSTFSGGKVCFDVAKYDNTNIERRPMAEVRLEMANGLTVGSNPLLREMRSADGAEHDQAELAMSLDQARQVLEMRRNAVRICRTALLHCPAVDRLAVNDMGQSLSNGYQLLRQNQVDVDVVDEEELAVDNLKKYNVVVVPEYANMSLASEQVLAQYVSSGGSVVATIGSSEGVDLNEMENRPLARLLGMSDVSLGGWSSVDMAPSLSETAKIPAHTRRPFNYAQVGSFDPICTGLAGSVMNFTEPYLEAVYGSQCIPLLTARGIDFAKVSMQPFCRRMFWPGADICTMAVAYEGAGRCVFFAAPVFTDELRRWAVDLDPMIIRAISWAKREEDEVSMVDAPRALRTASYVDEDDSQYLIILTHHATNDLRGTAVRYVDPSGPIEITIKPRFELSQVDCLCGGQAEIIEQADRVQVRVESVRYLEALRVR